MSQLQAVIGRQSAMNTIVELTSVFEAIASMRIAQTKSQVMQSQQFFDELWHIYAQLRVDRLFRYGRTAADEAIDKQLYIVITSEGGLSGDIDQKIINVMLEKYDPAKQDILLSAIMALCNSFRLG